MGERNRVCFISYLFKLEISTITLKDGFQLNEKDERIQMISSGNSHCLEVNSATV